MQNRSIVHMDLDSFFVSVERLRDDRLLGKPVIVGGMSDRGVVAACSYESRVFGVHSAMPMRMARKLCPDAIVLRGDFEAYSKYSDGVTKLITERAPVVEKASIDEFYLDMTGMDRFFGTYKFASELRETIQKETGLQISFGLSVNKTVSKVATNHIKPAGQMQVPIGEEKAFLAPMPVGKIPMIGTVTAQTLRNMGISQVGTLSQMPMRVLERTFGKSGVMLWERANGIDLSPVVPYHEQKSLSKEMTFDKDTTDVNKLRRLLISMTEQLATDLRQKGQCTSCITVKLRYSNFDTHTKQQVLPATASDHLLMPAVLDLFEKLYDRRLLIRLVGIRFSKLLQGQEQLNLFDDSAKLAPLYQAIDRIRKRYGDYVLGRAV
ncbi:DNA polymerase IV [Sandaracinomonas limnophila]|uniref:DNA polymerase IV n=1 Tax=Sandaracinomonas limnophila TaxID=1862386 RepID=A0A437PXP2_9BACT|nr:DNA polymerase IV [Sandaracinomonas limnophila]RVU27017.1 DNA polymerase IV [Sandaracinomonas limnophila]